MALVSAVAWTLCSDIEVNGSGRSESGQSRGPIPIPAAATNLPTATSDMVWIPGGAFWMGATNGNPDERPAHRVVVKGFWMDNTEVTNERFEKFVRATRYVTIAERKPDPKEFPGATPELLVPGSVVFNPPRGEVSLENHYIWWKWTPGASWRHPEGPASDIKDRQHHPVVHVCWHDAVAYARWAGKRLPIRGITVTVYWSP